MNIFPELASDQLAKLSPQARIIIVHPNFLYQKFLINQLLGNGDTIYVRFEGDLIDAESLSNQFASALEMQSDNGLATVHNLILDECDRADGEALDNFLADMTHQLESNSNTRMIIISRKTPRFISKQLDLSKLSVLLPVQNELMLCDYTSVTEDRSILEIHGFGSGRVYLNGTEIDQWDGLLPRSLFFYLVDRGMVTRNNIFEVFWPTLSVREATNVFHVTKRKISEVLGIDLTSYSSGFYHISPKIDLQYDVMYFSSMVQNSEIADEDDAIHLLTHAIELYRGNYLANLDTPWVRARRDSLSLTYGESLVSLAKIFENKEQFDRALGLYIRAVLTNPQREDIVLTIMQICVRFEMYHDALTIYERLRKELKQSLNVEPMPEIKTFAAKIQKEYF